MGINTPVGTSAVLRRDRGQYPENGHKEAAPAVQVQDRTTGEFRNHYTGMYLVLYINCRSRITPRDNATIG
jgi:hypothetical protein